jgi:hypothetical protein
VNLAISHHKNNLCASPLPPAMERM